MTAAAPQHSLWQNEWVLYWYCSRGWYHGILDMFIYWCTVDSERCAILQVAKIGNNNLSSMGWFVIKESWRLAQIQHQNYWVFILLWVCMMLGKFSFVSCVNECSFSLHAYMKNIIQVPWHHVYVKWPDFQTYTLLLKAWPSSLSGALICFNSAMHCYQAAVAAELHIVRNFCSCSDLEWHNI